MSGSQSLPCIVDSGVVSDCLDYLAVTTCRDIMRIYVPVETAGAGK